MAKGLIRLAVIGSLVATMSAFILSAAELNSNVRDPSIDRVSFVDKSRQWWRL